MYYIEVLKHILVLMTSLGCFLIFSKIQNLDYGFLGFFLALVAGIQSMSSIYRFRNDVLKIPFPIIMTPITFNSNAKRISFHTSQCSIRVTLSRHIQGQ